MWVTKKSSKIMFFHVLGIFKENVDFYNKIIEPKRNQYLKEIFYKNYSMSKNK